MINGFMMKKNKICNNPKSWATNGMKLKFKKNKTDEKDMDCKL